MSKPFMGPTRIQMSYVDDMNECDCMSSTRESICVVRMCAERHRARPLNNEPYASNISMQRQLATMSPPTYDIAYLTESVYEQIYVYDKQE